MQRTFHDPPSCGYARVSVRTRDREREDTERTVTHREFFGVRRPRGWNATWKQGNRGWKGPLVRIVPYPIVASDRFMPVFNGFTHVRPCADQLSPPRSCLLYNRGRVSFRQINRDSNVAFNVVVVTHWSIHPFVGFIGGVRSIRCGRIYISNNYSEIITILHSIQASIQNFNLISSKISSRFR